MDDAWDQFAVCPPGRLRVRVEESTSDIKLSEYFHTRVPDLAVSAGVQQQQRVVYNANSAGNRRDLRNIMLAVVLPVLTVFVVGGVMVLASALVDGDD